MELVSRSGAFVPDSEYIQWIADIKRRIRDTRTRIAVKATNHTILLYWSIGTDIIERHAEAKYGDGLYNQLSKDLLEEFPGAAGFSPRNLLYMKQMTSLFSDTQAFERG